MHQNVYTVPVNRVVDVPKEGWLFYYIRVLLKTTEVKGATRVVHVA
jgi:hypothetical protein